MIEHGYDGMPLAVLLTAVALAGLGALRWDALLLWLKSLFGPPADPSQQQASRRQRFIQAPRHLRHSELQHQAMHRRPGFHRSGRRG